MNRAIEMEQAPSPTAGPARDAPWRGPQGWMLPGLFLLICGAKFWLIQHFANDTPYWDQWISELRMINAYMTGTLTPGLFFQTHNEHHIVYSQLLLMLLFRLNGRWDPILQMIAQAPIHALVIVGFVSLAGRSMDNAGKAVVAGFAGLVSVIPFGWENTLWGDQSCFYIYMLFSIATVWYCWRYEALTPRWWLGAFIGFAGLFALASGTFTVLAMTAFLGTRALLERGEALRRRLAGVVILAAIAVFGIAITPRLEAHNELMAKGVRDFLWALSGVLAWPCSGHWAGILIQAPLILLVLHSFFRRVPFADGRWFVIIMGGTFWVQAAATAYRRCGVWASSRYCDSWGMLLIIGCASLWFLRDRLEWRGRNLFIPVALLWLAASISAMLDQAVNLLPVTLAERRSSLMEMENNVRQYLATGDPVWLKKGQIPFPFPETAQSILDMKSIRSVLPPNVFEQNPPLAPVAIKPNGVGFNQNGYPSGVPPLSKAAYGSANKGNAKAGMTLLFKVPRGTRQVDLQVAGYPNASGMGLRLDEHHSNSFDLAPPFDPGENWQTVSVALDPHCTLFKINAKDQSRHAWVAFSVPTISKRASADRVARWLADRGLYFIDAGLALFLLGALGLAGARADSIPLAPDHLDG